MIEGREDKKKQHQKGNRILFTEKRGKKKKEEKNEKRNKPEETQDQKFAFGGPGDLLIIEVQQGEILLESDIERLEDDFGRVIR